MGEKVAVKEAVAGQLAEAMREQGISKNRMARLLQTSRSQVDRLLDAADDITLGSLERAAAMAGRRVRIELVGEPASPGDVGRPAEVEEDAGWLG